MNLYIIIFRTFFYYILFLLLFRIMGKREIGELGVNDLLVSVLFAANIITHYYNCIIRSSSVIFIFKKYKI